MTKLKKNKNFCSTHNITITSFHVHPLLFAKTCSTTIKLYLSTTVPIHIIAPFSIQGRKKKGNSGWAVFATPNIQSRVLRARSLLYLLSDFRVISWVILENGGRDLCSEVENPEGAAGLIKVFSVPPSAALFPWLNAGSWMNQVFVAEEGRGKSRKQEDFWKVEMKLEQQWALLVHALAHPLLCMRVCV